MKGRAIETARACKKWAHSRERRRRHPSRAVRMAEGLAIPAERPPGLTDLQWRAVVGHIVQGRTYWDLATASGRPRSSWRKAAEAGVAKLRAAAGRAA